MKKIFIVLGICMLFLCISSVSANENNDFNNSLLSDDSINHINVMNNDYFNNWYVNGSKMEDGNGSIENPFNILKSSLINSNDGDTIYIVPGSYNGMENVNLTINKRLNLINFGNGDVIFDGDNKYQIFNITADSFNITGLTFARGNSDTDGGCIYFANGLKNSKIDANFIESHAVNGGAIFFNGDVINNIFTGIFINNNVIGYGGAIYTSGETKKKHLEYSL